MAAGIFTDRRRRRAVQRAVSILLLALCFIDLTVIDVFHPQLCEEGNILPIATASAAINNKDSSALTASTGGSHQAPEESTPAADDCFCCCAHVLPCREFRIPALALNPALASPPAVKVPISPLAELFHPPRIA